MNVRVELPFRVPEPTLEKFEDLCEDFVLEDENRHTAQIYIAGGLFKEFGKPWTQS